MRLQPFFILSLFFFLFEPLPKSDEINEMFFALAFLLFSTYILLRAVNNRSVRERGPHLFSAAAITFSIIITLFLGTFYPFREDMQRRMLQFASDEYVKYGLIENSTELFNTLLNDTNMKDDNVLLHYAKFIETKGNSEEAAKIYMDTLVSLQKKTETEHENPLNHIMMGDIYCHLGNIDAFRSEYLKAAEGIQIRFEKEKDNSRRIAGLCSLVSIYSKLNDYQRGVLFYREAYSLCRNKDEKTRLYNICNKILLRSATETD